VRLQGRRRAMLTCSEGIAVHDRHSTAVVIPHIENQRRGLSRRKPGSQWSATGIHLDTQRGAGSAFSRARTSTRTHAESTPAEPKYIAGIFSPSNTISARISLDLVVFHAGSVSIRGCSVGSTESRSCRM
jgi:hypothetical protein